MNRQQKLEELYEWAKGKSLVGIESVLFNESLRRYRCSYPTAESYARVVRIMLQERSKPLAAV